MKIKTTIAVLFFYLITLSISLFAQTDSINTDIPLPGHPRILLLKGEEKNIQEAIRSNKTLSKIHLAILAASDTLLAKAPLQRIQIGRRLLDKSRECIRRVFYLSYAYRLTGKDVYLKRAEKEMLAVAAFENWNPTHFLDVAEMTLGMAIGYDWLYNDLPARSREIIKAAILKNGIQPSFDPKHNGWLKSTNNWNQVCNAGISYGALAVYEDDPEMARTVLNRAIRSIKIPMEQYAPDGAYVEGYSYWGYGTGFNVLFLSAIEKLYGNDFGLSSMPGFLKTGVYLENMTGATGIPFNYFDAGVQPQVNASMFWFSQKLKDRSLLWSEMQFLATENNKRLTGDRLLPAALIWSGAGVPEQIPAPGSLMFYGLGSNPVALMRTSWTDKNAVYAGLKGGSPSLSHAHMDAGSFIMEADGVRWAMDLGMQEYESLESKKIDLWNGRQNSQRWKVFRYNNLAHNTLAVNNQFQKVEGKAPITSYSDNGLFMNAVTDITGLYEGLLVKANRGVAIADKSYVIIRDELETADTISTIRWTMVTPADVKISGSNEAILTRNGKTLVLRVSGAPGIRMKTWSTAPVTDYDAANPGTILVGFEVTVPAHTKLPLTVYLLPGKTAGKILKEVLPLQSWPQ